MKVVLLQTVPHVGKAGEVKEVANGYARNYLIPRGLAKPATPAALAEARQRQEAEARREARLEAEAAQLEQQINQTQLTFRVRVGEQGRLYGSITAADIAEQLARQLGREIDKRRVELAEPIRQLGRYQVPVRLAHQHVGKATVVVEAEG